MRAFPEEWEGKRNPLLKRECDGKARVSGGSWRSEAGVPEPGKNPAGRGGRGERRPGRTGRARRQQRATAGDRQGPGGGERGWPAPGWPGADAKVGRPPGLRTAGRTEGQRAALTMSSMVLSSITESGSMAAPAAPPRSPRSAANGPGRGGGGSSGGGGGSRTHSSCQPAGPPAAPPSPSADAGRAAGTTTPGNPRGSRGLVGARSRPTNSARGSPLERVRIGERRAVSTGRADLGNLGLDRGRAS